jgi:hypothetical protein
MRVCVAGFEFLLEFQRANRIFSQPERRPARLPSPL